MHTTSLGYTDYKFYRYNFLLHFIYYDILMLICKDTAGNLVLCTAAWEQFRGLLVLRLKAKLPVRPPLIPPRSVLYGARLHGNHVTFPHSKTGRRGRNGGRESMEVQGHLWQRTVENTEIVHNGEERTGKEREDRRNTGKEDKGTVRKVSVNRKGAQASQLRDTFIASCYSLKESVCASECWYIKIK